eukprot:1635700-Rhodomonas_salina.3
MFARWMRRAQHTSMAWNAHTSGNKHAHTCAAGHGQLLGAIVVFCAAAKDGFPPGSPRFGKHRGSKRDKRWTPCRPGQEVVWSRIWGPGARAQDLAQQVALATACRSAGTH